LKILAGDRYRVTWEAPPGQRPTPSTKSDPWLAMIPTKTGHLFTWGADTLGVWLEGRRAGLVRQLVEAGATVRTQGTDGATLVCPIGLFDRVSGMTGARRRRKLSAEAKAAAVERLARYSFGPARQSDFRGPVCPVALSADLGAVQNEPAAAD
jgi:hypothetical protein